MSTRVETPAMSSWDRGTIVLREPPPDLDVEALPGVLWDPRTRCWRAPAWRYRDLASRLGLSLLDATSRPFPEPALRPYQGAALDAWESAGHRGVVVLPTGAGKTRTAVAAIARTGLSTLCVTPTRVLAAQWHQALRAAGVAPVGQLGDGVRDVQRITVATTASAKLHAERLGDRFALLVVDEVHHHAGADETLELYLAPARLGLTATPPEDDAAAARLTALVGPVVARLGIDDLAGTFLAPFDLVEVPLDLDAEDARTYREELGRFRLVYAAWARTAPDLGWPAFVAAASRSESGRKALAAWRRARELVAWPPAKSRALAAILDRQREARVLVFTHDNATAYTIAREHLVAPLTCDIGRSEREALLTHFAEGRLHALVSARVLNEGVDVPEADVAVVTGGSQGSREYVQRVGRVLRPTAGKRALVLEFVMRGTHEVRQVARGRARLAAC